MLLLSVLLWAHEGRREDLADHEVAVLALLPEHGGRLVTRVRRDDESAGPDEVQLIEFTDDDALASYLADPRRTARTTQRDAAIARTDITRVVKVTPRG